MENELGFRVEDQHVRLFDPQDFFACVCVCVDVRTSVELAFGVWRFAFRVWRLVFGVWRLVVVVA